MDIIKFSNLLLIECILPFALIECIKLWSKSFIPTFSFKVIAIIIFYFNFIIDKYFKQMNYKSIKCLRIISLDC